MTTLKDSGWLKSSGPLTLGLWIFLLSLLISRGTYSAGLILMGLSLLLRGVYQPEPFNWTRALGVFMALMTGSVLQGVLMATDSPGDMVVPLFGSMVVVAGILQLPPTPGSKIRWEPLLTASLVFFVTLHLTYDVFWTRWPKFGKSALFTNIHYIAQYAVFTLPFLVMEALRTLGRVRWLMVLLILGDLWLLLESRSRPGYLSLIASVLVVLPYLGRGLRWQSLGLLVGLLGILYLCNVAHFQERINEMALHFYEDERGEIWFETWLLQSKSTPMEWLLGHGLGQFAHDYQIVSLLKRIKPYWAPHCFLFEIIYSHGLLGLMGLMVAGVLFFQQLLKAIRISVGEDRTMGLLLLAMATALVVDGFFTIPFWSRNFLYPMSLVVGASFLYLQRLLVTDKPRLLH
jgi:hypothetical protein